MLRIALTLLAVGLLTGACQNRPAPGEPRAVGAVLPTVAGRAPAAFDDGTQARKAFTRRTEDGVFSAVLEDAAWLRFQGTPEEVEESHRAYFKDGYTTFQIQLDTSDFTNPTQETFVLEDSAGRRVFGKGLTYRSSMASGREAFEFMFNVSFQHAITQDTRWLRLTRQRDGKTLAWSFE